MKCHYVLLCLAEQLAWGKLLKFKRPRASNTRPSFAAAHYILPSIGNIIVCSRRKGAKCHFPAC